MEKSIFSQQTVAALMALILMGCQGSDPLNRESNPVKDYKKITDEAVPLHDQKLRQQSYAGDLYVLDVSENGKAKMIFNFAEGVAKTYNINIRALVDKVVYRAKLVLPSEAEGKGITLSSDGKLSWTPPAKTIPATQGSVTYKAKIILEASTVDAQAKKLLANKDLTTDIEIKVSRQEAEPKIKSIEGINEKAVYESNQKVKFRMTVIDQAMSEVRSPVIHFEEPVGNLTDEQKTKKGYVMSVNSFARGKVTKLGNGTWAVDYTFWPDSFFAECAENNIDLSKIESDVITVVTSATVVSYGQKSPESNIAIQIKNPKKAAAQGAKK